MNRARSHSIAHKVWSRIARKGGDTFWSFRDFSDLSALSVAATLSRLSRRGSLRRIHKGVYYHPKSTVFGESKPDPERAADAILHALDVPSMAGGSGSYNRLGITSQVSGVISRLASRRVRLNSVLNIPLKIEIRPKESLTGITVAERTFLDVLRNINRIPDTTPDKTLARLGTLLETKTLSFGRLASFASTEPPHVRALLGALGESVRSNAPKRIPLKSLDHLRSSLNGLTTYNLRRAAQSLPSHSRWNLV